MDSQKILKLINEVRQEYGRKDLSLHEVLVQSALGKAMDMKEKEYFSHQSPQQKKIVDFVPDSYHYYLLGENLAFGFQSEEALVEAFLKSPTHRSNLLDPDYLDIGIGVVPVEGRFIVAQVFGVEQEAYLNPAPVIPQKEEIPLISIFFWFLAGLVVLLLIVRLLKSARS